MTENVVRFADLGLDDVETVGGKNASLGEMVQHLSAAGVSVPDGFATTADAYRRFLAEDGLADRINALLADLDVDDTRRLAEVGASIRAQVEARAAGVLAHLADDPDAWGADPEQHAAIRNAARAISVPATPAVTTARERLGQLLHHPATPQPPEPGPTLDAA